MSIVSGATLFISLRTSQPPAPSPSADGCGCDRKRWRTPTLSNHSVTARSFSRSALLSSMSPLCGAQRHTYARAHTGMRREPSTWELTRQKPRRRGEQVYNE